MHKIHLFYAYDRNPHSVILEVSLSRDRTEVQKANNIQLTVYCALKSPVI